MKPATLATVVLLLIIATAHLLRVLCGLTVVVGGVAVPMWASVVAVIVPVALAAGIWREHSTGAPAS